MVIEWLSDGQEPLHGYDYHPHHGHGDGDVLDWVGEVRNHSVEPVVIAHSIVSNKDIVKEEHEDHKTVNKG